MSDDLVLPGRKDTRRWRRVMRHLGPVLSVIVFAIALLALHRILREFNLGDVIGHLRAIPTGALSAALFLTVLSYLIAVGHDLLALRHLGRHLGFHRTLVTSFVSFAVANNIGFALLTGGSVRYRAYSTAGLSGLDVVQLTLFIAVSVGLGAATAIGFAALLEPPQVLAQLGVDATTLHAVGVVLLLATGAFVGFTMVRRTPLRIGEWQFRLPSPPMAIAQTAVALVDIAATAAVLFVLLPPGGPSLLTFVGLYAVAQLAVLVSHVPGGLGVFEAMIVLLLPSLPADAVLGSLIAFRAIYFFLPLVVAASILGSQEYRRHKRELEEAVDAAEGWLFRVTPTLLGTATLLGGIVLLLSGASPAVDARLAAMRGIVPLPLIEISHMLSSVAGLGLVILSRSLFRRIDTAYWLAILMLLAGIGLSLAKGLDFEEAIILVVVLLALLPARRAFYRRASVWRQGLSAPWVALLLAVIGGSVWLGVFSFANVEYSRELWWRFALFGDAPRFLRASLVVILIASAFLLGRLLRPLPPAPQANDAALVDRARPIIACSTDLTANLALLGDKRLLFSDGGQAFLMYNVAGRSWVVLGDPIGVQQEWPKLVWRFRELCDAHHGRPVFYEIGLDTVPLCLDLGLSLIKLGEEGRVDLTGFSLDGSARKGLRYTHRKLVKQGADFTVVEPAHVPELLPELQVVSDEWLAKKRVGEKGFSLGAFEPSYISNFSVAVVRLSGRVIAFANLWLGAAHEELSVDVMRHTSDAPNGTMDYLFIEAMLWGQSKGFRSFNLGIAPLSGLHTHPLAPLWHKIGNVIFRYGEHFYNFEGLRQYKEKFDPEWEPRYMASPGGLATPRILLDITTLISGG